MKKKTWPGKTEGIDFKLFQVKEEVTTVIRDVQQMEYLKRALSSVQCLQIKYLVSCQLYLRTGLLPFWVNRGFPLVLGLKAFTNPF